jgi:hypothetical protein
MDNKIILPKDIAKEVEEIRLRLAINADHYLLSLAFRFVHGNFGHPIFEFAKENFDLYVRAIVNGYEVETTPEESLREYYDELYRVASNDDPCRRQYKAECQADAVLKTLDILGIKIEGVNA